MNIINISNAKDELFKLVNEVNIGFNPIMIVNNNGKNAVLISENEWKNIEEGCIFQVFQVLSKI